MKKLIIILLIISFSGCFQQKNNSGNNIRQEEYAENTNESSLEISNNDEYEEHHDHLKNELLLEAYNNEDYTRSLALLKDGADNRILLRPGYPIFFDICQKYIGNDVTPEIIELFNFYLENCKEAFEDSISGMYPGQTIGSYLARFVSFELLQNL